ncbi:MAG: LCP family protein [Clostridia bacterium]|nr:LCP family protein [Clostridia bacterium]
MSEKNKFIKKTVPRLVAALVAVLMGLGLFVLNRYIVYKPDSGKNNDIKFTVDTKGDKQNEEIKFSEKSFNFLVMGHDRIASLTDVILIINYDTENQKVTMMQFPRDTYFRIDDYYYHKINGLFNYCIMDAEADGAKDPEAEGLKRTAEYFEKNLAIKIHYSAVMDLDGFEGIVDAIGGVDMYVPMRMYYSDPYQTPPLYIDLQEGYQHLDGKTAEQFVRYRYGYITGDYGRQDAQKLFISAFIDKLKSSITDASTVAALAKNVITYVDTDITDADIVYFGKCFLGIGTEKAVSMEDIKMFTMPGDSAMWNTASMYCMNREYVADLINEYFNIYDFDIHDSFDKDRVFTPDDGSILDEFYYADKENILFTEYNAGGLKEDGLN